MSSLPIESTSLSPDGTHSESPFALRTRANTGVKNCANPLSTAASDRSLPKSKPRQRRKDRLG